MKKTFVALMCACAVPAFADIPGKPAAPSPCASAPVLIKAAGQDAWSFSGREIRIDKDCLAANGKPAEGILWIDQPSFADGVIEFDVRGKDEQGKSFVGLAFHGSDETHYDAVYFRPFNFKNAARKNHSIQYISLPAHPWFTLREKFPGKYENAANAELAPGDWFHVRIEVKYPQVRVFVNGKAEPSLAVTQLSSARQGRIGLWTANNEGHFRNLSIIPAPK